MAEEKKIRITKDFIYLNSDKATRKILESQNRKQFLKELKALELPYCKMNLEKYIFYLNEKLSFPFNAFYIVNNGMFGLERTQIKVDKFFETHQNQGLKCICTLPGNVTHNISLHLIELDEGHPFKALIDEFKNWHAVKP